MVINEKALLPAMREEYKNAGYTVARRLDPETEDDTLVIEGADWLAEISWKNVPNKVLALIVEHLKDLPKPGQAFKAKKKDPQTVIFNMVDRMPDASVSPVIFIHRTCLLYGSMEVWQKTGNNGCVFVPMENAEMLLDHGRSVIWAGGGLYLEGEASRIFVQQFHSPRTDTPETEAINYLSGKAWS